MEVTGRVKKKKIGGMDEDGALEEKIMMPWFC